MAVSIFGFPTPTPIADTVLGVQGKLARIKGQRIQNKFNPLINQARINLLGEQTKGQREYNDSYPGITKAKLDLLNAQAAKARQPREFAPNQRIINTPDGIFSYDLNTKTITRLSDANGRPLKPILRKGLSVQQSPEGGFSITEGGVQLNPMPGQSGPAPNGMNTLGAHPPALSAGQSAMPGGTSSNLVTSPGSPHSKYSNAGSTLFDRNTGMGASVLTTGNVGRLQKTLSGELGAIPSLEEIFSTQAPLLGWRNLPERLKERALSAAGFDERKYREYISTRKTLIPNTTEQLLSAFNINATTENKNAVQDAITSDENENPYVAAYRIAQTIGQLQMKEENYKNILKRGYALGATKQQMLHGFVEKAYQHLLSSSGLSNPKRGDSQVLRETSPENKANNDPLGIR